MLLVVADLGLYCVHLLHPAYALLAGGACAGFWAWAALAACALVLSDDSWAVGDVSWGELADGRWRTLMRALTAADAVARVAVW